MSAEVESMMYVGAVPWHGFGTYVGDQGIIGDRVLEAAGLDWEVEKRPLFTPSYESDGGILVDSLSEITSHRSIVRTSDNSILGIVGKGYTPLQNGQAVALLDGLAESGQVTYHTAGSLRDGRRVWLLAKVDSYSVIGDDRVDEYLMLWNSHDGSSALRVLWTKVRVVCANTANAALSAGRGQGMTVRHTVNMMHRLDQANEILGVGRSVFSESRDFDRQLVRLQMNSSRWANFADELFPIPDGQEDGRSKTIAMKKRDKLTELFEVGRGQDMPGVAGTGWAAYNALTEYTNYHRTTRGGQDIRFESAVSGSGAALVRKGSLILSGLAA